eukprot:CAMPEP_0116069750 /NCGR_PEP_ID=MMETSP0322-20121206/12514_1 /TAXON_ID=163516 /ORGANISM="Leptocylindrus danicus var. apora, Strain B651" /LENGTH=317 /DNA_ID=CAMNT_0003557255 /DNA_START=10 /DNA_END=963 /DNA_ORIENTATION=+
MTAQQLQLQQQAINHLFPDDAVSRTMKSILTIADASLAEGVQSVGFNGSSNSSNASRDRYENMFRLLHSVYDKNLDKLELYCERNIFAADYKLAKRILKFAAVGRDKDVLGDRTNDLGENVSEEEEEGEKAFVTKVCEEDVSKVVTAEEMMEIDDDLKKLRMKLVRQKRRRDVVKHRLEIVQQTCKKSQASLADLQEALQESSKTDKLYELVSAVMMGKDILEQAREEGSALLELMDQCKTGDAGNRRMEESFESVPQYDDQISIFTPCLYDNKHSCTLEQVYESMRKQIKTEGNGSSGMRDLIGMFKKKRKVNRQF